MSIVLTNEIKKDPVEMRKALCDCMIELAEKDPDVVMLDADLMSAAGTKAFKEKFPDRHINCGIQEANMMGVAAGMSAAGFIPFIHTFGCFATRRAYDQIYLSGAYSRLNVKIIGSDPGVVAALNGGTHMPFEDIGTMRSIPGMTAIELTDPVMLKALLPQIAAAYGMHYLRIARKDVTKIYEEGSSFEIGKAATLKDGEDATIIASGYCVAEALKAAAALAEEGISVRVLDMFTWKPLDLGAVVSAARDTGAIVTAENHNIVNGLGAAVAGALVKTTPVPMEMVGIQDEFGEVGPADYLAERFKIKAKHISESVHKAIGRKKENGC